MKRALEAAVRSAIDRREMILAAIDTELDDLEAARTRFAAIEAERESMETDEGTYAFHLLEDRYDQIDRLEDDVETILAERQRTLGDGVSIGTRRRNADEFHEYVYDGIDVKYPVLAEGVALVERLERDRATVLHRLTSIV